MCIYRLYRILGTFGNMELERKWLMSDQATKMIMRRYKIRRCSKAKEMSVVLCRSGVEISIVAEAAKVSPDQVKKWLEESIRKI